MNCLIMKFSDNLFSFVNQLMILLHSPSCMDDRKHLHFCSKFHAENKK